MKKLNNCEALEQYRQQLKKQVAADQVVISVCGGSGCLAFGGEKVAAALQKEIKKLGSGAGKVQLKLTGCHGFCEKGPLVVIRPQGVLYTKVKPEDAPEI
ncbi:MAG: (2Fe-2S) ferredoxin domain-containing protein, partial [Proteobacteria bacterium]|nr:(2Fe-2S) ferredoxin domain-containing protein [Pseudomonadota bacterium]